MRIFKWVSMAVVIVGVGGCGTTSSVSDCQCPDTAPAAPPKPIDPDEQHDPTPGARSPAELVFEQGKSIELPAPRREGGMPLLEAIARRHSVREYDEAMLSLEQLSTLLFAAHGISRPDSKKRTTPTARNWQDMEVYLATGAGLFVYDASAHALNPVLKDDIRAITGKQSFVATAPLNLVYVSDYTRMEVAEEQLKDRYSAAHAGFISQNVYLYCTSAGLATVVRAYYDKDALHAAMKLPENKHIVLAQTIGFPADKPPAD